MPLWHFESESEEEVGTPSAITAPVRTRIGAKERSSADSNRDALGTSRARTRRQRLVAATQRITSVRVILGGMYYHVAGHEDAHAGRRTRICFEDKM